MSLQIWTKATLKSLLVPGGVLLLGVGALAYSGWLTLALPALGFLYYCALGGSLLLAWRFHSSRIFLATCVLFLAEESISVLGTGQLPAFEATVRAAAILVPIDFLLISLLQERGFTLDSITPVGLLLFVESVIVFVLGRASQGKPSSASPRHLVHTVSLPDYAWVIIIGTGLFLLIRFLFTRKPVESALLWALSSFIVALHFAGNARLATLYSAAAACILCASIIENSYLLAYQDELTSLPSRRAFNDAVLRLQDPYSIAVIDIDHFKRFNDTYGHDTGDQVLRLVATNLARVAGGGRAYRCGGEEFTILFPGKTTPEVVEHLERLRESIAGSEFHMRGGDRRQAPRGADRRGEGRRRRTNKGQAIRELAQEKAATEPLSVTVSIGVATSSKTKTNREAVLKAADKALYRAKANGRNRVETATAGRRPGTKAAGIA